MNEEQIIELKKDIATVKMVLGTLITWIAQTSGGPLSCADAEELLDKLK